MSFVQVLVVVSAFDLLLNFFFHLLQLRKFCNDELSIVVERLVGRVDSLSCTIEQSQRNLQYAKRNDDENERREDDDE